MSAITNNVFSGRTFQINIRAWHATHGAPPQLNPPNNVLVNFRLEVETGGGIDPTTGLPTAKVTSSVTGQVIIGPSVSAPLQQQQNQNQQQNQQQNQNQGGSQQNQTGSQQNQGAGQQNQNQFPGPQQQNAGIGTRISGRPSLIIRKTIHRTSGRAGKGNNMILPTHAQRRNYMNYANGNSMNRRQTLRNYRNR